MNGLLRFRVLGDSLAAGVGCTRVEETLGERLAAVLREEGHAVDLGVHAVSGARSTGLDPQVRAAVRAGVDVALIVIARIMPPLSRRPALPFTLPAGRRALRCAGSLAGPPR